jgi:hypothetical protein
LMASSISAGTGDLYSPPGEMPNLVGVLPTS